MIISTYQQFYKLIKDDILPVTSQLGECIDTVGKICNCKKQQKIKKSEECNNIYINFIKQHGENFKDVWRGKTTDPDITFNHNTHHTITVIKLR